MIMVTEAWLEHIGKVVAERYTLRTLVYGGKRQAEFLAVAADGDEKPVTVAVMEPDPDGVDREIAAIDRARQLQHPNLLHILDGGECAWDGTRMLFIVTEATEGTLAEALAEVQAAPEALLDALLPALEWLHGKGLVYRNLHQDTVVRAGGRWKLADLSRLHAIGQFEPIEEKEPTTPPEAALGWILPAWDIWGLGVLLRDALALEGQPISPPFDAIVRGCLEPDYKKRLSLQSIRSLREREPEAQEAPPPEEAAQGRSRVPVAPVAAAVILFGLGVAWWLWPRSSTPPVAPVASQPRPQVEKEPARPVVSQKSSPFEVKSANKSASKAPIKAQPNLPVEPAGRAVQTVPQQSSPSEVKTPIEAPNKSPINTGSALPAEPEGRADYFGDDLEGHPTASGEIFSNQGMTAASQAYALGTRLRVTNLRNHRSVTVRVNDRGALRSGFIIRVSRHVAEELDFVKAGSARVKLQVIK